MVATPPREISVMALLIVSASVKSAPLTRPTVPFTGADETACETVQCGYSNVPAPCGPGNAQTAWSDSEILVSQRCHGAIGAHDTRPEAIIAAGRTDVFGRHL